MRLTISACALALITSATTADALDPDDKCKSSKMKTGGKYGFCRLNAESKAAKTGGTPNFSKCDAKFSAKWAQAESTAGMGVCPSEGDQAAIQTLVTQHTDTIAACLGGMCPATCGDGIVATGEDCDVGTLNSETCVTEGFAGGT